jgi:hypothetical protein
VKFLARILVCFAAGLLFSHQVIAHHHHEELNNVAQHHNDGDDDADHHDDLPNHQIAHIFSFESAGKILMKIPVQDLGYHQLIEFAFSVPDQINQTKEYVEVPPPLLRYYKYFSLRAPPAI